MRREDQGGVEEAQNIWQPVSGNYVGKNLRKTGFATEKVKRDGSSQSLG